MKRNRGIFSACFSYSNEEISEMFDQILESDYGQIDLSDHKIVDSFSGYDYIVEKSKHGRED